MFMLVSMTLTLMQGNSGSTKQAISITETGYNGRPFFLRVLDFANVIWFAHLSIVTKQQQNPNLSAIEKTKRWKWSSFMKSRIAIIGYWFHNVSIGINRLLAECVDWILFKKNCPSIICIVCIWCCEHTIFVWNFVCAIVAF